MLTPKWVLDFYALADNPTILALISQEADTTQAAVVSLMEVLQELSPTVQIPVAQAQAAPVQAQAALLPALDLHL